ncbi:MAG: hypothetical protein ACRDPR_07085, partial [Nocardioidaceae bacterium]
MRDAVRLALGTLTVLPTRPPAVVDREVAGRAMTLAPLVGAVLAVLSGLLLVLLGWGPPGGPTPLATILGDPGLDRRAHPFLAATLV